MSMSRQARGSATRERAQLVLEVSEPAPAVVLVQVAGELNADGAETLRAVLSEHLTHPAPCRLLVDLSQVDDLPQEGLDLLLALHRRCRIVDTHLLLVGAGHRAVHQPLRISGLLPLFDMRPTVPSALTGAAEGGTGWCSPAKPSDEGDDVA